jgi:hypothetical protein
MPTLSNVPKIIEIKTPGVDLAFVLEGGTESYLKILDKIIETDNAEIIAERAKTLKARSAEAWQDIVSGLRAAASKCVRQPQSQRQLGLQS